MFIMVLLAVLLLVGLLVGGYTIISASAKADFVSRQDDIDNLLREIYRQGKQQSLNLRAMRDTVQPYADNETVILNAVSEAATSLATADTPEKIQAACKGGSRALAALYVVAKYYPPLVISIPYLISEEASNAMEDMLSKSIDQYNSAVSAYNTKLTQLSNRPLARDLEPLYLINA